MLLPALEFQANFGQQVSDDQPGRMPGNVLWFYRPILMATYDEPYLGSRIFCHYIVIQIMFFINMDFYSAFMGELWVGEFRLHIIPSTLN